MNTIFRKAVVSLLAVLLLSTATPSIACDSSMLAILTGSSRQKEITTKTLAICLKIQQTGVYLNSFNHCRSPKITPRGHGKLAADSHRTDYSSASEHRTGPRTSLRSAGEYFT